jgi:hypothetical protein
MFFGVIMSVHSVLPSSHCSNSFQQTITNTDHVINSGFWQAKMTQNGFCGMTTTEATRFSLRLLGMGSAGACVTAITATVLGATTWPIGLLSIPCALGAAGAIWYSFQLDDYENSEELAKFRDDASRMNLEQVMQVYGWNHVLQWGIITAEQFTDKYRQQMRGKNLVEIIDSYESAIRHLTQCHYCRFDYQIPIPAEWKGQWRGEVATKTFEQIIQTYPLDKLEKYNLLEVGELCCIKNLKHDYDGIQGNYNTQIAQIEGEFQRNTELYQCTYQSECSQADQSYNENVTVRRLKDFELDYVRQRQMVHETANRHKNEARDLFNRSVAALTNHGEISYDRLSGGDKLFYDKQNNELQISILQADNEAQTQISHIDRLCIEERTRLHTEEQRIRNERIRITDEAKRRYDTAVSSHFQNKQQRLAPIELRFRSAVEDINGRYHAYLRTIGVAR